MFNNPYYFPISKLRCICLIVGLLASTELYASKFEAIFSDPSIPASVRTELASKFSNFERDYKAADEIGKRKIMAIFLQELDDSLARHLGSRNLLNNDEPMSVAETKRLKLAAFGQMDLAIRNGDLNLANSAASAMNNPASSDAREFFDTHEIEREKKASSPAADLKTAQAKVTIAALKIAIKEVEDELGHHFLVGALEEADLSPALLSTLEAEIESLPPKQDLDEKGLAKKLAELANSNPPPKEVSQKKHLAQIIKSLRAKLASLEKLRKEKMTSFEKWREASNAAAEARAKVRSEEAKIKNERRLATRAEKERLAAHDREYQRQQARAEREQARYQNKHQPSQEHKAPSDLGFFVFYNGISFAFGTLAMLASSGLGIIDVDLDLSTHVKSFIAGHVITRCWLALQSR